MFGSAVMRWEGERREQRVSLILIQIFFNETDFPVSTLFGSNTSKGPLTSETALRRRIDCEHAFSLELLERDLLSVNVLNNGIREFRDLRIRDDAEQEKNN